MFFLSKRAEKNSTGVQSVELSIRSSVWAKQCSMFVSDRRGAEHPNQTTLGDHHRHKVE
jgi:hypothetical protein